MQDWVAWHGGYDDPASPLRMRLDRVTWHLARALDRAPPGPIQLLSLCAGQGRDVLEVLPDHPRRADVAALLVEVDAQNAALARQGAADAGLRAVRVRQADASVIANFADVLPAYVLLLAGIFGNVSDADIKRTIEAAPGMCAPGATVIWTRHRRPPDLTRQIRCWFEACGFEEVAFDVLDNEFLTSVGVHRLVRAPASGQPASGQSGVRSAGSAVLWRAAVYLRQPPHLSVSPHRRGFVPRALQNWKNCRYPVGSLFPAMAGCATRRRKPASSFRSTSQSTGYLAIRPRRPVPRGDLESPAAEGLALLGRLDHNI